MASERKKLRRRFARCRARLAWQSDKGKSKREFARWRAAVRVGLTPPAPSASARLLRASTAVGESTFTNALRRFAGLPSDRALNWQREQERQRKDPLLEREAMSVYWQELAKTDRAAAMQLFRRAMLATRDGAR